jgi:CheY-like chemotaxis protein/tRNA A-37 threonylcarbamoyl transferase component Bud32
MTGGDVPTEARPTLSVGELRHDLRTPVNHIVGYTEMLLEDAGDPHYAWCRSALEDTLAAAREVLNLINTTLNPSKEQVSSEDLSGLYRAIRTPQSRIINHMRTLLGSDSLPPGESFGQDLLRIKAAAEKLVPHENGADAPAGPGERRSEPRKVAEAAARVLVVDDVEDNREVLRRRLEREGYAVTSAGNGREALTRIGASPFDLVLLDVMMPELDGYAVLEQLKSAPETRDIPVIMISALDDMANVVRCIERGAEDYLPKPFDAVLLRARISACLEKKRLRDQEKRYLEDVNRVIEAASAVETGHYTAGSLAAIAHRDDALGRLARVFDGMVGQVKEREERLRQQIRELRGDIDVARRETAEFAATLDAGNLTTGATFADRYEILGVVGRGGMGTVYRAKDVELGQEVAIKTLRSEFLADDSILERFKSEIRLTYRITHRNVVRTHYFGEWSGGYYLTMEFVEGVTLRQLLDTRGHLSVPSTLAIGTQLAESLAVAHDQGVIHRDIKPQNLLLDPEGVIKVMDFGIARLAERTSSITEVGLSVGTPAYMSPEQLLADEVDARSDLYSTGLVLYECLTGRLPFEARSPVALISKVLTEQAAPPTQINPDIPSALSSLIMKLLGREPGDRVQSARELAQQLAELG